MHKYNTKLPLVSVIIPVYNAEEYLHETIESVQAQTYQNWELILVNDGSTDNSALICKLYCQEDNRIILIETNNRGACYARNQGILRAKGEYILFMDADDLLTDDCLQYLEGQMVTQSVDIVCGNSLAFNKNKEYAPCTLHLNDIADSGTMLNDVLLGNVIGSIWGKLYKKESIDGVLFHNGLLLGQDINFLTNLFLTKVNLKVYRDSHVVYRYRIVKNSISHNKKNSAIKVRSYIDAMANLYYQHYSKIQETCIRSFSKNLTGSVFVYFREQPFLRKTIDEKLRRLVCELGKYVLKESYATPINVIINGSPMMLNIYFSVDQIASKFRRYTKFICRK